MPNKRQTLEQILQSEYKPDLTLGQIFNLLLIVNAANDYAILWYERTLEAFSVAAKEGNMKSINAIIKEVINDCGAELEKIESTAPIKREYTGWNFPWQTTIQKAVATNNMRNVQLALEMLLNETKKSKLPPPKEGG